MGAEMMAMRKSPSQAPKCCACEQVKLLLSWRNSINSDYNTAHRGVVRLLPAYLDWVTRNKAEHAVPELGICLEHEPDLAAAYLRATEERGI